MAGKKVSVGKLRIADKTSSIGKKKSTKMMSKKKQHSLAKSAKVMIDKMNKNTTDDDIMNIMMSLETNTDTKAVVDGLDSDREEAARKEHGLRSLQTEHLKKDQEKDRKTAEKQQQVQSDIAAQLKLIDDFTL